MTVLTRYLLRHIGISTALMTIGVTLMIWLTQSLRLLELVVEGGAPLGLFAQLLLLTAPKFFQVSVPIAFAISVAFTAYRLMMDSELVIMQATGMSYRSLTRPVLILGIMLGIGLFLLAGWVTPWANREMDRLRDVVRSDYSALLLRPRVFNHLGRGVTLYTARREGLNRLNGVTIHIQGDDTTRPSFIFAREGGVKLGGETPILEVIDGRRQVFNPETGATETLSFDRYDVRLDHLSQSRLNPWVDEDERSLPGLFQALRIGTREGDIPEGANRPPLRPLSEKRESLFWVEAHNRVARSFLVISFGLVAMTFMLHRRFNRRHLGRQMIGLALGLILLQAAYLAGLNVAPKLGSAGIGALYAVAILPGLLALRLLRRQDSAQTEVYIHRIGDDAFNMATAGGQK